MYKLITQQLRCQMRNLSLATNRHSKATTTTTTFADQEQPTIEVTKALDGWSRRLKDAGVGSIDFNLKCLVAHVLGRKFNTLHDYKGVKFTNAQLAEFQRLCEARCARMPLQYLLGEWDFMDLTLKMAPTVFIPRPETEEFVRYVIEDYRHVKEPVNMLEVGCGSGAMSLAILHTLPQVKSTAIERSKMATALAAENAKRLGLLDRFTVYNHTMEKDKYMPAELTDKKFDLIISNPPYVKSEEFPLLQPEVVVYENLNALDGGSDGLRVARLVFELACLHLRVGGKLWLELGNEHPPMVQTVMNDQYEGRLRFVESYSDQYKRERFVQIVKV